MAMDVNDRCLEEANPDEPLYGHVSRDGEWWDPIAGEWVQGDDPYLDLGDE